MYCKDCEFNKLNRCENEKIDEDYGQEDREDMLIYDYTEGGGFSVGDMFGCIHFKHKDT